LTAPSLGLVFNSVSPFWLLLEAAYMALAVGLLVAAFRSKNEWVRAGLGVMGVAIISWHVLAILPSWWLYYADGVLGWGGNGCTKLDMICLKQIGKDMVVVGENAVGLGALVVAFLMYQKKFPKQLAPGEPKREATGGYK
jgi:NADH:ubiquinone oxidoreductase subunit K